MKKSIAIALAIASGSTFADVVVPMHMVDEKGVGASVGQVTVSRERREDFPLLANYLLAKISHEYYQRTLKELAPETMDFLKTCPWPGNIRELENAIGRALINVQESDEAIEPAHVVAAGAMRSGQQPAGTAYSGGTYAEIMDAWEKSLLQSPLQAHGGNRTATAKSLGMAIRNLHYKLKKHQLF